MLQLSSIGSTLLKTLLTILQISIWRKLQMGLTTKGGWPNWAKLGRVAPMQTYIISKIAIIVYVSALHNNLVQLLKKVLIHLCGQLSILEKKVWENSMVREQYLISMVNEQYLFWSLIFSKSMHSSPYSLHYNPIQKFQIYWKVNQNLCRNIVAKKGII